MSDPKILPLNLTARLQRRAIGNPAVTTIDDAVANCYPGLELDLRNLDRRFFPGLVFEFVARSDISAPYTEPKRYGALLSYLDQLQDPDIQRETTESIRLRQSLSDNDKRLSTGSWYLHWVEQSGKRILMESPDGQPLDGMCVWRLVRSLEPSPVTICLQQRSDPDERPQLVTLQGWRRLFVDPATGELNGAYQAGEMLQSLCSPWQHDFRDCGCEYWAANHPDIVYGEVPPGSPTLPDGESVNAERANVLLDWMREDRTQGAAAQVLNTISKNRPFQFDHFQINQTWQQLNVTIWNTEIGAIYVPTRAERANPYSSHDELAGELRKMAQLELALTIEYLYAYFSLHTPEEVKDSDFKDLPDNVQFIRQYMLLAAVSEMTHTRWTNQLLWELREHGFIKQYEPELVPATQIPTVKGEFRQRSLRRLDKKALEDFIEVERPGGYIDTHYERITATLRRPVYPKSMADLAVRLDSDGMLHYSRFRDIQRVLKPYDAAKAPHLREIHEGTPAETETKEALDLFSNTLCHLKGAYQDFARNDYQTGGKDVGDARLCMDRLRDLAERLAGKKGLGIPFFSLFDSQRQQ